MIKLCKNCKKPFDTKRNSKKYCSEKCFSEYRKRPEILEQTLKLRKQTNLKKYGVDNPAKSEDIKEKAKRTCLEKYGVVSPTQNEEIHNKQIKTCLEKYGVENPQQNEIIKKRQQTSLFQHFGVVIPLKNEDIKEKAKRTCLEKYGVDNPSKNKDIKEKIVITNTHKYGVKYPALNDIIKSKMIKSSLKNHYNNVILKSEIYNNVIPLFTEEEYKGNVSYKTTYPFKCKKCNTLFEDTLLSGNIPRCIVCNPIQTSISQNKLCEYIKTLLPNNTIEENNRSILNGLELDIYIPSLKIAFEFNGLYWHSEINGKKNKVYHLNKTKRCSEIGIKLIHIFEDEWLFKEEIVKNKLKHLLYKNNENKIFARKCIIKEVNSKECNIFLNRFHIQGADKSSIKIGAYNNNELVSIMTFGKLRMALGNKKTNIGEYEMYRFCVGNKNVIGIAGKLLNYFIKTYNPIKIISYVDNRWSDKTNCYLNKLGFKYIKSTPPNYWYINNYKREYRFNYRKDQLSKKLEIFDPNLTEWENMKANGWDRIWDCGSLKYEWVRT